MASNGRDKSQTALSLSYCKPFLFWPVFEMYVHQKKTRFRFYNETLVTDRVILYRAWKARNKNKEGKKRLFAKKLFTASHSDPEDVQDEDYDHRIRLQKLTTRLHSAFSVDPEASNRWLYNRWERNRGEAGGPSHTRLRCVQNVDASSAACPPVIRSYEETKRLRVVLLVYS